MERDNTPTALAAATGSSTQLSTSRLEGLIGTITDETQLTDAQFREVAAFADAPVPTPQPATREEFGAIVTSMLAVLPVKPTDENKGKLKSAIYLRSLGHLPNVALQKAAAQAIKECDWFPSVAAMLKMADAHTAREVQLHQRARYLVRERRQRQGEEKLELMGRGELDIADMPDRLIQIGVAKGFLFRRRDGSHAYRTADNLAADEPETVETQERAA